MCRELGPAEPKLSKSRGIGLNDFYVFSCLIAVIGPSSTMLNKRAEREHPCLVPDLRGESS